MRDPYSSDLRNWWAAVIVVFAAVLPSMLFAAAPDTAPTTSQFAGEVGKDEYGQAEPPATAGVFRWDFSKEGARTYAYSQEVRAKADLGDAAGDAAQELSAKGTLLIRSLGSGSAELVLKDLKLRATVTVARGARKAMEQTMPSIVVQGVTEDGTGAFGNSSQDMLLKLLFPVPNKSMAIGESTDVPAQIPFSALGSVLKVNGRCRMKLTRFVTIANRTCAQFDVDTDISELKVPPELQGDYKFSAKGTSVLYFDTERKLFVSGTVALLMQLGVDAPMPELGGRGQAANAPRRSKMSTTSDNLIRVKLVE